MNKDFYEDLIKFTKQINSSSRYQDAFYESLRLMSQCSWEEYGGLTEVEPIMNWCTKHLKPIFDENKVMWKYDVPMEVNGETYVNFDLVMYLIFCVFKLEESPLLPTEQYQFFIDNTEFVFVLDYDVARKGYSVPPAVWYETDGNKNIFRLNVRVLIKYIVTACTNFINEFVPPKDHRILEKKSFTLAKPE